MIAELDKAAGLAGHWARLGWLLRRVRWAGWAAQAEFTFNWDGKGWFLALPMIQAVLVIG